MKSSSHPPSFRWHLAAMLIVVATRVLAQTSPFEIKTDRDAGYPQITPNYFFEKVDALEKNPWRYAKVDQFEVLSRCSEAATKRFVAELGRRLQLMKSALPAESIASPETPVTVLLYLEDNTAQLEKQRQAGGTPNALGLPFHFGDASGKKVQTIMVNLWPYEQSTKSKAAEDALIFTAAKLAHWFTLRPQPWPWNRTAWLWRGLAQFCIDLRFASGSINFASPPGSELWGYSQGWTPTHDELLPMEALFSYPPPIVNDVHLDGLREIQLGLFIRWALLGDHGQHREAFWKFALRARATTITEALFQEHFGLSYAQVRTALGAYLGKDLPAIPLRTFTKSAIVAPNLPTSRTATIAEIERFKEAVNRAYDETRPRA